MLFQARHIGLFIFLPLWWKTEPVNPAANSYLALGDSYTIGQSVAMDERYPIQVAKQLNADHVNVEEPQIMATTGWTTGDLLDALKDAKLSPPYDFVTLLIGVNDQYQQRSQTEYRERFSILLKRAVGLAGDRPRHVAVLSIPDYSITPFAQGRHTNLIALQIDSFNMINRELSQKMGVHYLDITGESRKAAGDPSLIASDGLHFSGKEYRIWAALLEPIMKGEF